MEEVAPASAAETLARFHEHLLGHFSRLHEQRQGSQVFALEHGLSGSEASVVQDAVRAAYRQGLPYLARRSWLPFVVHAAEVGYVYDGIEYWPIFRSETPGWSDKESERDRIRDWFVRFASDFGGAVPHGTWAGTFRKIAWPITHAVLPKYLQVQLAHLLFDYRTGWPAHLGDPDALGIRLHSWSHHYSERLEQFCQNTSLVGHLAVALLLPDQEGSPFIEAVTLDRLTSDLNSQRQSRTWLEDARRSASTHRSRGFRATVAQATPTANRERLPAATDPRLELRLKDGEWGAYATLPNLRPLQHSLQSVYEAMRTSRAQVSGSRTGIPVGGLLYATPPQRLSAWPLPAEPFLQLPQGSPEANRLLADQCRMTAGPWWVFKHVTQDLATEVKTKFIRPGNRYSIVGDSGLKAPDVSWCDRQPLSVEGVSAFEMRVPPALAGSDAAALLASGISIVTDVQIRPVGVVAAAWDGEGSAEWLAGEPALISIRADYGWQRCRLSLDGTPYHLDWPTGEGEIFLELDDLAVGTHELVAALEDGESGGARIEGTLLVTVREPEVRLATASEGEGIRLRTSPAQPSLPELWDGRATVNIDGPTGSSATLEVTLFDESGGKLGSMRRDHLSLPVDEAGWAALLRQIRDASVINSHYDQADVARLSIGRSGVGFASLLCERGFRGLRWVLTRRHQSGYSARLIDRTDSGEVGVELFSVERPLVSTSPVPGQEITGPTRGGLLRATCGASVAAQIIPPDPNTLLQVGLGEPQVVAAQKSLAEVRRLAGFHRLWMDAELPADPFGERQRQRVLDAITSALVAMLTGGRWASLEQELRRPGATEVDRLEKAKPLVGDSPQQRELARVIGESPWKWTAYDAFVQDFSTTVAEFAAFNGLSVKRGGPRFLLQLVSSPGELLDWPEDELSEHIRCVLVSPALVRVARFAAWGYADLGGAGV